MQDRVQGHSGRVQREGTELSSDVWAVAVSAAVRGVVIPDWLWGPRWCLMGVRASVRVLEYLTR